MRLVPYKKIFLIKIILGCFAIIGILWYMYISTEDTDGGAVVFLVDMQESMKTQDVDQDNGFPWTRQVAMTKYIHNIVETIEDTTPIGIVRLGYYPDYIVPPTTDREMLDTYITSLGVSPLSPEIFYETGDISLHKYLGNNDYYVILSDKETTLRDVQSYATHIYTVFVGSEIPSMQVDLIVSQEKDIQNTTLPFDKQSSYLSWIFVLVTVLGYILL